MQQLCLPGGRAVKHSLHLRHELSGRTQARQVGAPCRGGPALRPLGQLGNEVGNPSDVSGERLGLEVEDELTLGQKRPTTSRGSVLPLRGGESWLPVPGVGRTGALRAAEMELAAWKAVDSVETWCDMVCTHCITASSCCC